MSRIEWDATVELLGRTSETLRRTVMKTAILIMDACHSNTCP